MSENQTPIMLAIALICGIVTAYLPARKRWDGMCGVFLLFGFTLANVALWSVFGLLKNKEFNSRGIAAALFIACFGFIPINFGVSCFGYFIGWLCSRTAVKKEPDFTAPVFSIFH